MTKKQEKLDFERCVMIKKANSGWLASCKLRKFEIWCKGKAGVKAKANIDFKIGYDAGEYDKYLKEKGGEA